MVNDMTRSPHYIPAVEFSSELVTALQGGECKAVLVGRAVFKILGFLEEQEAAVRRDLLAALGGPGNNPYPPEGETWFQRICRAIRRSMRRPARWPAASSASSGAS